MRELISSFFANIPKNSLTLIGVVARYVLEAVKNTTN
jgi:hypothetical protein